MKVLHLLVSGNAGGIETLMKHYCASSDHRSCCAFLWDGGTVAEEMEAKGVRTVVLSYDRDGARKILQRLTELVKEERFDVVVSHHSAPFLKLILLWMKLWFPRIRILAYAHANARDICQWEKKRSLWLRRLIHWAGYAGADGVIAVSESVKRSLTEYLGVPERKIRVIYNGTPLWETCPERSGTGHSLVYVGRLIPEKGVQVTLRALAKLPVDYTLTIVGDGPYRRTLEDLAGELKLKNRVTFLGVRSDTAFLLARADIFVHSPLWEEGFGLAVVEAMAAGCICVCADAGAIPEIITDGVNGWLVKKNDPEALARILERAASENRERIRQNGLQRAKSFSVGEFCTALDGYIREKGRETV